MGITTLFVTHDQEEALAIADRVGVMREGHLEQLAPPTEVYSRPATSFVAEFVGLSNRLSGEVRAASVIVRGRTAGVRGLLFVAVRAEGERVEAPDVVAVLGVDLDVEDRRRDRR